MATAVVFTPSPLLTVTIEAQPDGTAELHVHGGGQGVWIARMMSSLGCETRLAGPFGGESGEVLQPLIEREGIVPLAVPVPYPNGAYVHDRREGERSVVATHNPPTLERHDHDQLYDLALIEGLAADVVVLGGPDGEHVVEPDTYRRLAADLSAQNVPVVVDLSGDYLEAAVSGGVHLVKVSHEELLNDGRARSDDPDHLIEAAAKLREAGAANVVVSRAGEPALALLGDRAVSVQTPTFQRADHRGAGDSMTAGLAVGTASGLDLDQALILGAAAGTLNTTRHGLATGERELIERLRERVTLQDL
ncbi:PfkB family carbohydrate kinase [Kineosporia sp. NBRC 101731]|uniref:1-phosphofructokinase family hexose kinase n=1 Tax=Kineosporia sp. NBRC 101731 TaxID=3032199 RepID=UPI0024A1134C|nr:PfkB family carbohydrate kinase [Kineosporia sp. NBRC 101731]GLY29970.1 1-phosphofructokinase [Kineosporia sp. NBRC 101731]